MHVCEEKLWTFNNIKTHILQIHRQSSVTNSSVHLESRLFYESYDQSIAFYTKVLGAPAYVEGTGTRGWQIGTGWLTLLRGTKGNPRNVEVTFDMATPAQAEKLQQCFINAGGTRYPAL